MPPFSYEWVKSEDVKNLFLLHEKELQILLLAKLGAIVGTGSLAATRSPVGENDYQSFSKTHRPFHYPDGPLSEKWKVKSEEFRVKS